MPVILLLSKRATFGPAVKAFSGFKLSVWQDAFDAAGNLTAVGNGTYGKYRGCAHRRIYEGIVVNQ
jgi:hypothetical protein